MTMQLWIIIILLGISFYQFVSPEKANKILEPVWGPVQKFIGDNNPLGNNTNKTTAGICPNVDAPVCGDNKKTYTNSCEAALDNVLKVTPGAC